MHKQSNLVVLGGLTFATVAAGVALVNPGAKAAQQATAHASVTVQSTCSMTATVNTAHNATLFSGTYSGSSYPDGIGKTTIQTFCNDLNGYSIYAIGYTNNELGNTVLKGTDLSSEYDIVTGTATSGSVSNDVSNWAMKISAVSGTYAPTIVNGFGSFSAVPSSYTKVATLTSATDSSEGTNIGSSIETTYAAYIARLQPAGTYSGQVRYALVHPSSPETQSDYVLQNIAEWENELLPGIQYSATDARDGSVYTVSLLKDGKIWLLDNLALDLTDPMVKANLSAANTNASATTLNYLKNGGGTTSDKYATAGVANWTSSYSYSAPLINTASKDTTQSYGSGSGKIGVYYNYCAASAGSYCYGDGTSYGSPSGNATEDICPKGWRMPTGGASGEYQSLYIAYSSNATNFKNALRTPLSGYFLNGSANNQDSNGYFWSSTYNDSSSMYYLVVNSSNVYPQIYNDRYYGFSVRCVSDPAAPYTIYYDKNTADTVSGLPATWEGTINTVRKPILSATTPSRSNYEFIGWCDTAPTVSGNTDTCSGVTYMPGSELPVSGSSTTVYAMWQKTEHAVTIALTGNATGVTIDSANYTTSAALAVGTYTISGSYASGYEFDSWATSGNISVASTSSATTTMTVNGPGTLTLNGKQSCVSTITGTTMQSFSVGSTNYCVGATGTLTDSRDGASYTVGKLADGKFWLLDNLRLDLTNSTVLNALSTSNTNASAASLTSLRSGNRDAGDQYAIAGVANWTSGYSYSAPLIATSGTGNLGAWTKDTAQPLAMGQSGTGKIGVYYNYCAASAGSYCYGDGTSYGSPSVYKATEDICPKGWRMPTSGSSGEYQALYAAYSSDNATFVNALRTPISGDFADGLAREQGSYGTFWSSTSRGSNTVRILYVVTSNVVLSLDRPRTVGYSIRCILGS